MLNFMLANMEKYNGGQVRPFPSHPINTHSLHLLNYLGVVIVISMLYIYYISLCVCASSFLFCELFLHCGF